LHEKKYQRRWASTVNGREKAEMNAVNETFDEARANWEREQNTRAEANRLFNPAAVHRIEKAVGKPVLDRDKFVEELERVARNYAFRHDVNDRPPDGKTEECFNSLEKHLRSVCRCVANLVDGDADLLRRSMIMQGMDPDDISKVRNTIEGLPFMSKIVGDIVRDKPYRRGRIESLKDERWLIEKALPEVYRQHFGEKFGFSRDKNTGIPSGPGIRFIIEALSILGVNTPRDGKPFGAEAIEYYLRSARN
jgi:hypothetical protein